MANEQPVLLKQLRKEKPYLFGVDGKPKHNSEIHYNSETDERNSKYDETVSGGMYLTPTPDGKDYFVTNCNGQPFGSRVFADASVMEQAQRELEEKDATIAELQQRILESEQSIRNLQLQNEKVNRVEGQEDMDELPPNDVDLNTGAEIKSSGKNAVKNVPPPPPPPA